MSKRKKKKHGSKQKKILKYQSLVSNTPPTKPELSENIGPEKPVAQEAVAQESVVQDQESTINNLSSPSIVNPKYNYVKKEVSRISKLMAALLIFEIGLWYLLRFTTVEEHLYRLIKL